MIKVLNFFVKPLAEVVPHEDSINLIVMFWRLQEKSFYISSLTSYLA